MNKQKDSSKFMVKEHIDATLNKKNGCPVDLKDNDILFNMGFDSFDMLALFVFIENTFDIDLVDSDINMNDFKSLELIYTTMDQYNIKAPVEQNSI